MINKDNYILVQFLDLLYHFYSFFLYIDEIYHLICKHHLYVILIYFIKIQLFNQCINFLHVLFYKFYFLYILYLY